MTESDPKLTKSVHSRLTAAILDAVGHIPSTGEHRSGTPLERARQIASASAVKAALAAGALAVPPVPLPENTEADPKPTSKSGMAKKLTKSEKPES